MPVITVPQDTSRQDAMNGAMNNILGGLQSMEQNKKQDELNRRQQAFQAMEMQQKAREQGYDVAMDPYLEAAKSGDVSGIAAALKGSARTPEYMAKQKREALELQKLQGQVNKLGMSGEERGTEKMPASRIALLSEGQAVPNLLKDLEGTLSANKDLMGPIAGRVNSLNPYNERAKSSQAQIEAVAQATGKFLEGGVLRAEDVVKYKKMLPQMNDTPEVASNKLAIVNRMVAARQQQTLDTLKRSGYDTSGFDQMNVPNLPSAVTGGANVAQSNQIPSLIPQAQAAQSPNKNTHARPDREAMALKILQSRGK